MNNKERAAMQQALEALEELHYSSGTVVAARMYESATAALREALAEQNKPLYRKVLREMLDAHEQAEQEPVAWILTEADGTMDFDCQPTIKPTQNDYDALREGETFTPLYAAPVRTKDLTDDEIADIRMSIVAYEPVEWGRVFARAVIAADREKNK